MALTTNGTMNDSDALKPNPVDMAKPLSERLTGIEFGRILACFAVIVIHQNHSHYGSENLVYDVLNGASRWSVPFFFVLSGYFMPLEQDWLKLTLKYARRLAPMTLFWITVYAAIWSDPIWFLGSIKSIFKTIVTGGVGYHLWFLPSLGLCLFIAAVFTHFGAFRFLAASSLALFLFGLALGSYAPVIWGVPIGEVSVPFGTRNGPFFGLIFVCLGILLRKKCLLPRARTGAGLVACGTVLFAAEVIFLNWEYQSPPTSHNYLIGSLPLVLGAVFLFLVMQVRSQGLAIAVRLLGSVSLGIYAVHAAILPLVTEAMQPGSIGTGLAVALAVLLIPHSPSSPLILLS